MFETIAIVYGLQLFHILIEIQLDVEKYNTTKIGFLMYQEK